MYGLTDKSLSQRTLILILECVFLVFVYWFLFMNGNDVFHLPKGDFIRRVLLFVLCLITFFRMNYAVFFLLKRGITWGEALNVPLGFALYYIGFSMLGGTRSQPIDWIDGFAVFVFLMGGFINTFSEILRGRWKKDRRHQGKLYSGGLFKYAIHINYFGDVIWVCGFAMLTRNLWSGLIPLFLLSMFIFFNIPLHDRYLRDKYGESFREYENKTKKLIPFVY